MNCCIFALDKMKQEIDLDRYQFFFVLFWARQLHTIQFDKIFLKISKKNQVLVPTTPNSWPILLPTLRLPATTYSLPYCSTLYNFPPHKVPLKSLPHYYPTLYFLPHKVPLNPSHTAPPKVIPPPICRVLISSQRSLLTYQRRALWVEFSNYMKKFWVIKEIDPLKLLAMNASCFSQLWN